MMRRDILIVGRQASSLKPEYAAVCRNLREKGVQISFLIQTPFCISTAPAVQLSKRVLPFFLFFVND